MFDLSAVCLFIMNTQCGDGIYHRLWRDLYTEVVGSYSITRSTLDSEIHNLDLLWRSLGIALYTQFLPELGKALDKCFATGDPFVYPDNLSGEPLFEWLTSRILGPDGRVSLPADVRAVQHIRQLTYVMYKLEVPYSPKLVKMVELQWTRDEKDVERFNRMIGSLMLSSTQSLDSQKWLLRRILLKARTLVNKVLGHIDPREIKPSHGPGVVATGERVHEKTYLRHRYASVELMYPFWEYMCLSLSVAQQEYQDRPVIDEANPTSKVVFVPKDSRGPRLISCEPLSLMWLQQGLKDRLYQAIENHPLTKGRVNFADQGINRQFALRASRFENWVTLDLKNASDRVGLELVKQLFAGTRVLEALLALRSTQTRFGDYTVPLHKYAPMGSALCFPVEALVFWCLIVACVSVHKGTRLAEEAAKCFVYGDDIVVPRENYNLARTVLEEVGLTVNDSKCCVSGFFAESCGCDAFMGIDVTPVRFRTTWSSQGSPSNIASWVDYSNRLYERGFTRTAQTIEKIVRGCGYNIPYLAVEETVPGVVRALAYYRPRGIAMYLNTLYKVRYRYSRKTHSMYVEGYTLRALVIQDKRPDSWCRVMRAMLCADSVQGVTGTYALTRRVRLKRVWIPISIYWSVDRLRK
jgi:hypothetical protein